MLGRASSLFVTAARVSRVSSTAAAPATTAFSRRFSYSNQNKPESKETANEALKDAQAGKSAAEVKDHKATTGGQPLARESGAAGAKATKKNATSDSQPVNRADAGPDVLREKGKKSNKTDVSN